MKKKKKIFVYAKKAADKLCSNTAHQRLCFCYTDSTQNFKLVACFCDCTGCFMSDLVGNPEDQFSRIMAQSCKSIIKIYLIIIA